MTDNPDLEAAYRLSGPDGSKQLYAAWAETYDSSFAEDMQYRAPQAVAECYAKISGVSPVLDLGAGTGLLGAALVQQGIEVVDGTDISPQMLVEAEKKHVYQSLFEGDLTQRLEVDEGTYAGVVSSGTFTHGHVGPDALEEVLRCMTSGAWAVLSVNATHWDALGFEDVLKCLAPQIAEWRKDEFALYGACAKGAHAADTGWLLQMRKA